MKKYIKEPMCSILLLLIIIMEVFENWKVFKVEHIFYVSFICLILYFINNAEKKPNIIVQAIFAFISPIVLFFASVGPLDIGGIILDSYIYQLIIYVLILLFCLYWVMYYCNQFRKEMRKTTYDSTTVTLVICSLVYIILFFGVIYTNIYLLNPSSFNYNGADNIYELLFDFCYFSTVTFTTLGYGDIYPTNTIARGVVMLEVLIFVVFITVIALGIISNKKHE